MPVSVCHGDGVTAVLEAIANAKSCAIETKMKAEVARNAMSGWKVLAMRIVIIIKNDPCIAAFNKTLQYFNHKPNLNSKLTIEDKISFPLDLWSLLKSLQNIIMFFCKILTN